MSVNIRRDVKDSFYRYKMPKLVSKIEGRGNGIKTVVMNMSDIAKSLSRPASYPTKFFGSELGAQVKCDEGLDKYIVNGAHEAARLQSLLDVFIEKFVLCGECSNPETDLIITKDEVIRDCKACGQRTAVDPRHKLTSFILKNTPKAGKKDKKSNKNKKEDGSEDGEENTDDELTRHIEEESKHLGEAPESKLDDDWADKVDEEAVADRQRELGGISREMAKKLNLLDDDEEEDDPLEKLADFVQNNPNASNDSILKEIASLGIREDKAVAVLVQVLFDGSILSALPKKSSLFAKLVEGADSKGEKAQKAFLGGVERLVGVAHPELMSKIPLILKSAFDLDLLDEEVILAWGKKPSKKYVSKEISAEIRSKATPFLTWLAEAEEESDEDD